MQIEVVEATVTLTAPETAVAGATFEVAWSTIIDGRDFITIVPIGTDKGTLGNYIRANTDNPGDLQAPSEPGFYEIRYVLNEGRVALAIVQIEITAASVSVTSPSSAVAGATFEVAWSQVIDGRDFITLVPLGTDEGTLGNYLRANTDNPGDLQAPAEPGFYEVRYVLNEGRTTLTTVPIEIVAAEVTIETTAAVIRATDEFVVTWTNTVSPRDYITIVPLGTEEGTLGAYRLVSPDGALDFEAPEAAGLYEVRYVLNEGRGTLAATTIEVVPADAALNQGATLDIPETVAPEAILVVNWTARSPAVISGSPWPLPTSPTSPRSRCSRRPTAHRSNSRRRPSRLLRDPYSRHRASRGTQPSDLRGTIEEVSRSLPPPFARATHSRSFRCQAVAGRRRRQPCSVSAVR